MKPLEENIKRAQYFLNDWENLKHSLSAAIDYANKTAKALHRHFLKNSSFLLSALLFSDI